MSTFTWLDYSDHERRAAMEVIDLLGEDDTRDELGLGTIRDPLSDLLFPGTSTIQTRARYFLFVPWVYAEMDRKNVGRDAFGEQLKRVQGRLCDALKRGGETEGVIGFRAGLDVRRRPSSVYWVGLRTWQVLRSFDGSEDDYARLIEGFRRRANNLGERRTADDGGESFEIARSLWDRYLPPPPEGWLQETQFALSREEAEYLAGRIQHEHPHSLLHHLLSSRQTIAEGIDFAWDVPWRKAPRPELAAALKHAQNFSETLHGAALLYNLLLAEQKRVDKYVDRYREALKAWADRLTARQQELTAWNLEAFWRLLKDRCAARVPGTTIRFVQEWLPIALNPAARNAAARADFARQLIREREHTVKPGRTRINNIRAIELWKGSAGSNQLDFRWSRPVRAVVNDILKPLNGRGNLHA